MDKFSVGFAKKRKTAATNLTKQIDLAANNLLTEIYGKKDHYSEVLQELHSSDPRYTTTDQVERYLNERMIEIVKQAAMAQKINKH
ncbi:hypothetical protein [Liquorilactobacillus nagelii]|jgi:hypothetical protein|uniref:hypothetical protein n=1 Tax=Liquorilactobacillus nagelii TaxID=82688 RepID=UPI0006EF190C|nr:hypothetical protein [Liquorilactobacillus nagelii]KRL40751.1 hypothetical protein FD45_GL001396 [Liquorilactobacillus nagelii DSM 13675]QYH53715.1 hypothetical protein G6O73_02965 [Liquorilactobacillus nagelii DSM 13675]